jgi:hypothetical protein
VAGTVFNYPISVAGVVFSQVPELFGVIETLALAMRDLVDHPYLRLSTPESARPMTDEPRSLRPILNQALNDALDLIFDCVHGRGRSAVRTARTLFELLVALDDVLANPDMDARFSRHAEVGGVLFGSLWREANALPAPQSNELQVRLRRLREDSQPQFDAAVADYGPRYPRDWAGQSLKDRADAQWAADYEAFYRWSSTEGHGTTAVQHGHWRPIGGAPVYRLGPALAACPTALAHGLDYFDLLLERFEALQVGHAGLRCVLVATGADPIQGCLVRDRARRGRRMVPA